MRSWAIADCTNRSDFRRFFFRLVSSAAVQHTLQGPDEQKKKKMLHITYIYILVTFITALQRELNEHVNPKGLHASNFSVGPRNKKLAFEVTWKENKKLFYVVSWLWITAQSRWFPAVFPKGADDCTRVPILFSQTAFRGSVWESLWLQGASVPLGAATAALLHVVL